MATGEPDPFSRAQQIDLSAYETSTKLAPLEVFMGGLGTLSDARSMQEMNVLEDRVIENMYGFGDTTYLGNIEKPGMLIEPIPTLRRGRAWKAFKMFTVAKGLGLFDDLSGESGQALTTYIEFQSRLEVPSFMRGRHMTELRESAKKHAVASRQPHPYPYSSADYRNNARRDIRLARQFGLRPHSALARNAAISLGAVVPPIRRLFSH